MYETDDLGRDMFTKIYNDPGIKPEYTNRLQRGCGKGCPSGPQVALYMGRVDQRWIPKLKIK